MILLFQLLIYVSPTVYSKSSSNQTLLNFDPTPEQSVEALPRHNPTVQMSTVETTQRKFSPNGIVRLKENFYKNSKII
jgi:hypothetical protein